MSDVSIGAVAAREAPAALWARTARERLLGHGGRGGHLQDLRAGFIVTLMTLPFLVSSGVLAYTPLGPDYVAFGAATGILCGVAGGLAGAVLRTSSFIATLPSAPLALIQGSFAATLLSGVHGDPAHVVALLPLTLILCGAWQCLFAWSGLVRIVKFTPYPVLAGFLIGLSLKTFLQQSPRLFGLPSVSALWDAVLQLAVPNLPMALFGLGVVAAIRILDRLVPGKPTMLMGIVVGTAAWHALAAAGTDLALGRTIGAVSLSRATPGPAAVGWENVQALLSDPGLLQALVLTSLAMAGIGMLDFTFTTRTAQNLGDVRLAPRKDLAGQGFANFAAAIVGGLPVTSSLGTSLALLESGGRTRLAPASLSVFLLVAALLVPTLIGALPVVVLTAALISVAWKMWDRWCLSVLRDAVRADAPEARARARRNLAIVAGVTVATGLGQPIVGAAVGVVLSCIVFIMEMSRPIVRRTFTADEAASKRVRSQAERAILAGQGKRIAVLDLQGVLFFGNADDLSSALHDLGGTATTAILGFRRVTDVDTSGAAVLKQIARRCGETGVRLVLAGPHEGYLPLLREALPEAGEVATFPSLDDALEDAEDRLIEEASRGGRDGALPLPSTDLASGLSAAELEVLAARLRPVGFAAGEALCRAGEPADRLWIVTRGSVSIRAAGESTPGALHGRRLAGLGPGTTVGELGLLDRRPRSADVVADGAVEGYTLSAEDFDALLRDQPHLGQLLLATVARLTAQRLRDTSDELRLAEG